MKKMVAFFLMGPLCLLFCAYHPLPGGDLFEVYYNGQRVHQQFVHADGGIKTLHLRPGNEKDKIEVLYAHCGQAGKNRMLTLKNDKEEVVKVLRFADADEKNARMVFFRRDVTAAGRGTTRLIYTANELPGGKLLAKLRWNTQLTASRVTGSR